MAGEQDAARGEPDRRQQPIAAARGAVSVVLAPPQLAPGPRVRRPQVAAEHGVHDGRAGHRGRAVVAGPALQHAPARQVAHLEPAARARARRRCCSATAAARGSRRDRCAARRGSRRRPGRRRARAAGRPGPSGPRRRSRRRSARTRTPLVRRPPAARCSRRSRSSAACPRSRSRPMSCPPRSCTSNVRPTRCTPNCAAVLAGIRQAAAPALLAGGQVAGGHDAAVLVAGDRVPRLGEHDALAGRDAPRDPLPVADRGHHRRADEQRDRRDHRAEAQRRPRPRPLLPAGGDEARRDQADDAQQGECGDAGQRQDDRQHDPHDGQRDGKQAHRTTLPEPKEGQAPLGSL